MPTYKFQKYAIGFVVIPCYPINVLRQKPKPHFNIFLDFPLGNNFQNQGVKGFHCHITMIDTGKQTDEQTKSNAIKLPNFPHLQSRTPKNTNITSLHPTPVT